MGTHTQASIRTATSLVNGTGIYHEIRGSGPPLVFVQGATGSGGTFADVADVLADEFTVVTYHRRGNSLSPRPEGWTSTSVDEQADDLAALIRSLNLAPAVIFGTSAGAVILLNLMLRHRGVLRGAIVHEPPLLPVLENAEETDTEGNSKCPGTTRNLFWRILAFLRVGTVKHVVHSGASTGVAQS